MLQIKHGQSQEILTDIFTQTTQELNFRKKKAIRTPSVNTAMVLEAPSVKAQKIRKSYQ